MAARLLLVVTIKHEKVDARIVGNAFFVKGGDLTEVFMA